MAFTPLLCVASQCDVSPKDTGDSENFLLEPGMKMKYAILCSIVW